MKSAERNETNDGALETKMAGATAQIREVVQKVESKTKYETPGKQARKILRVLNKKDKEEIVQAVLEKYYDSEELKPYQAELIKMQRHLERTGKKMVILFDGRDASGKGGTIRRVTRYMNEKDITRSPWANRMNSKKQSSISNAISNTSPMPARSFCLTEAGTTVPWLNR